MTAYVDTISILFSHKNCPMAKTWKADGNIESYGNAKYFDLKQVKVNGIRQLSKLLTKLEHRPNACIIRGKYVGEEQARDNNPDEFKPGKVLRRLTCFDDQPFRTILIEVDKYIPEFSDPNDPETCIQEFITFNLPEPFQNASFHWQLSNSAGYSTRQGTLNVHLWFWLARPCTSAELNTWAKNEKIKVDHSVFNPVVSRQLSCPVWRQL